ncbi:expressed unknown protein [Seminavis robusta]|uniref:Uncharacterized protein n=1 Tax=Seminavis robusta TaxID=568900 RepID=A0A9N8E0N5_9STRA|nr:expressed unknown protein [Seminavis robusta]|eukprot:Sro530_g161280.1 n/a (561) ;mRNA; r:46478-48425
MMSQHAGENTVQRRATFGSIMVARSNHERPSEMEIQLRSHSQLLRVVERQSLNGAHFMIQKSETIPVCVAARVYYPEDVQRFHEELANRTKPSSIEDINRLLEQLHGVTTDSSQQDNDIDGLQAFRDKFQYTVVICVLPPQGCKEYFDRPDSFVHRVQQIMGNGRSQHGKSSWVHFITDSAAALTTLVSIVESLHPRKREAKKEYFSRVRRGYFVPDHNGNIEEPNDAAKTAALALTGWAREHGVPQGEERILMSLLDNLGAIATANEAELESIPIEKKTRLLLHEFFGSDGIVDVRRNLGQEFVNAPSNNTGIPSVIEMGGGMASGRPTPQLPPNPNANPMQRTFPHQNTFPDTTVAVLGNPLQRRMSTFSTVSNMHPGNRGGHAAGFGIDGHGHSYLQNEAPRGFTRGVAMARPKQDPYHSMPGGIHQAHNHNHMPPPMMGTQQSVPQRRPSHGNPGYTQNPASYNGNAGFQAGHHQGFGLYASQYAHAGMTGMHHQGAPPYAYNQQQHFPQPAMMHHQQQQQYHQQHHQQFHQPAMTHSHRHLPAHNNNSFPPAPRY